MLVSILEAATFCGDPALSGDPNFIIIHAAVDEQVKAFLRRDLEYKERIEYPTVSGYDTPHLSLREWPIESITELRVDPYHVFDPLSVIPSDQLFFEPSSSTLTFLQGLWPAVMGSVLVTYKAGYYPPEEVDPTKPKLPRIIQLGMLKQIKLEWEEQGAVVQSETFADLSQTFVTNPPGSTIILDPSVRAMLQPHRSYA